MPGAAARGHPNLAGGAVGIDDNGWVFFKIQSQDPVRKLGFNPVWAECVHRIEKICEFGVSELHVFVFVQYHIASLACLIAEKRTRLPFGGAASKKQSPGALSWRGQLGQLMQNVRRRESEFAHELEGEKLAGA
jgi:hypothetical protein